MSKEHIEGEYQTTYHTLPTETDGQRLGLVELSIGSMKVSFFGDAPMLRSMASQFETLAVKLETEGE